MYSFCFHFFELFSNWPFNFFSSSFVNLLYGFIRHSSCFLCYLFRYMLFYQNLKKLQHKLAFSTNFIKKMLIFSSLYAFRRYHSVIYCILALSVAAYGIILIRASAHPAGVFLYNRKCKFLLYNKKTAILRLNAKRLSS